METKVVNVKVAYIRPQYRDLREWIQDPHNVYIGRKCVVFIDGVRYPAIDSKWANPFPVKGSTRENVCKQYRKYLLEQIITGKLTQDDFEFLRGKNLGCWCKEPRQDVECHGDTLRALVNDWNPERILK